MTPEFEERLHRYFELLKAAKTRAAHIPGSDMQYAFVPMDGYVSKLRES